MIVIETFLVGFCLGIIICLSGLPIPGPETVAGVAGILGITLAFILVAKLKGV